MEKNKTDRTQLIKGIKILVFALLSLFMGPTMFHMAYSNPEKPLYYPLLIIGCLICVMAVILLFRGINTIMTSIFGEKKR